MPSVILVDFYSYIGFSGEITGKNLAPSQVDGPLLIWDASAQIEAWLRWGRQKGITVHQGIDSNRKNGAQIGERSECSVHQEMETPIPILRQAQGKSGDHPGWQVRQQRRHSS
jgi:hypothetical protein